VNEVLREADRKEADRDQGDAVPRLDTELAPRITQAARSTEEVTSQARTPVSDVSLAGGLSRPAPSLTNQSTSRHVPPVRFRVIGISSATGTVRAINADNSGGGTSVADASLYVFSRQFGGEAFAPGGASAARLSPPP
jgi:hypothetical protein